MRRQSSEKINKTLYRWIHAPDSVTKAKSRADFEKALLKIDQSVFNLRYLEKLVQTTWTFVVYPRLTTRHQPYNWTNNGVESLNAVIKRYINWEPRSLIEIINIFARLFRKQFYDIVQSIYGDSDVELEPWMNSFKMDRQQFERLRESNERIS